MQAVCKVQITLQLKCKVGFVQWKALRPVDCRPASRRLLLPSEKASNGFNPTSCNASSDFDDVTQV